MACIQLDQVDDQFELWTSVGGEVPRCHRGALGDCMERGERWIALRKTEGFEEQFPSYDPAPIN